MRRKEIIIELMEGPPGVESGRMSNEDAWIAFKRSMEEFHPAFNRLLLRFSTLKCHTFDFTPPVFIVTGEERQVKEFMKALAGVNASVVKRIGETSNISLSGGLSR